MLLFDFTISGQTLLYSFIGIVSGVLLLIFFMRGLGRRRAKSDLKESKHSVLAGRNKYPAVDFFKYRGTFTNLSFAISLGIVFLLFGWTQYEAVVSNLEIIDDFGEDVLLQPPPPTFPEPPPPPPPPPPLIETVPDDEVIEEPPVFQSSDIESMETPPRDTVHHEKKIRKPAKKKLKKTEILDIVITAEQMPRFPGCEDMTGNSAAKKRCADQKMLQFIYKNIHYPSIAIENRIEGQVVAQFVVETDGRISNINIVKDIGGRCGNEVKRIISLMNGKGLRWTPGRQNGRPVRVRFTLPVVFRLDQ